MHWMNVPKISADIFSDMTPMAEVSARTFAQLEPHFLGRNPFIVRGLVTDWPLVQAGLKSGNAARDYLFRNTK